MFATPVYTYSYLFLEEFETLAIVEYYWLHNLSIDQLISSYYLIIVIMSGIVLTYFPTKARAESIKIALQLAHLPYTNHFVENWPVEKQEGLKNGTLPFGQVPMLHIDGLDIVQSGAILRYISRK